MAAAELRANPSVPGGVCERGRSVGWSVARHERAYTDEHGPAATCVGLRGPELDALLAMAAELCDVRARTERLEADLAQLLDVLSDRLGT